MRFLVATSPRTLPVRLCRPASTARLDSQGTPTPPNNRLMLAHTIPTRVLLRHRTHRDPVHDHPLDSR